MWDVGQRAAPMCVCACMHGHTHNADEVDRELLEVVGTLSIFVAGHFNIVVQDFSRLFCSLLGM